MSDVDLDKLRADFPREAIKQRAGGGGRSLSYVEGFTVIRRLNEACPAWDFAIVREWQDGNLLKAHVRLTIPGLGSREHVGVQVFGDRPGTEDVQAKGHITDALKKAATLFGVGLELYGPDYEAGEIGPTTQTKPPSRTGGRAMDAGAVRIVGAGQEGEPRATPPQLKNIERLVTKTAKDRAAIKKYYHVEHMMDLSRKQASALIERLMEQAGEKQEATG